jgi:hypothetical protein
MIDKKFSDYFDNLVDHKDLQLLTEDQQCVSFVSLLFVHKLLAFVHILHSVSSLLMHILPEFSALDVLILLFVSIVLNKKIYVI